jgi:hypothetical protein
MHMREENTMIVLVIGFTAALGFLVLGVWVFVLGKSPPTRAAAMRNHVHSLGPSVRGVCKLPAFF